MKINYLGLISFLVILGGLFATILLVARKDNGDPSVPNGRPYCSSWTRETKSIVYSVEEGDCQLCPSVGWWCERPRLVACDGRYYDEKPIGAICGRRDSRHWRFALRKIDELRNTLRIERGKRECGEADTKEEISVDQLREQLYDDWLGDREHVDALAQSFKGEYFDLLFEVLKTSQEHFEIYIESPQHRGVKKYNDTLISSRVSERTFLCDVKLVYFKYQLVCFIILIIFLGLIFLLTTLFQAKNTRFDHNITLLGSLVISRLRQSDENLWVVRELKSDIEGEIRRFSGGLGNLNISELWVYIEEIVEEDERIVVGTQKGEKAWTWTGAEEEEEEEDLESEK